MLKEDLIREVQRRKYWLLLSLLVFFSFYLSLNVIKGLDDESSYVTVDAAEYVSIVDNLAAGNGYKITGGDTFSSDKETSYRSPGYPYFLWMMRNIFGPGRYKLAVVLYQHFLLGFFPVIFYFMTYLLVKNKNAALAGALFSFLFYPFRYLATIVHPDFLALFFLLIGLCLFLSHLEKKNIYKILGFSLGLALAVMIKQNLAVLLLLFLYPLPKMLKKKEFIAALIFPVLFISLWVSRNYNVHGKFPVFTTNGGLNFYYANHPDIKLNLSNVTRYGNTMKELMAEGKSEVEADRELYSRGFKNAFKNGLWWQIGRIIKKLRVIFRDFYPPTQNELFFLLLPFILVMKHKKYPLIFLLAYQLIYGIFAYKPGFGLTGLYYIFELDLVPLNFIGLAALLLFLVKKDREKIGIIKDRRMIFLCSVYFLMLLPALIFIPLDRLTVSANFLLVITYSLAPLVLKDFFIDKEPETGQASI